MQDPRPAMRCGQVTVQNVGVRQYGAHRRGGKGEEKKYKVVFPTDEGKSKNPEKIKAVYVSV